MLIINIAFIILFIIRLMSLKISIRHEKALIQQGAIQYGKKVSILLSFAHIVFYFSALIEANQQSSQFTIISQFGLILVIFSLIMLFYVINQLKDIWTVKLYILPNHKIHHSWLFDTVRHPNYFLNIIPELIGISLLCQAKYTALIGFPLYLVILFARIKQEEKAMSHLR